MHSSTDRSRLRKRMRARRQSLDPAHRMRLAHQLAVRMACEAVFLRSRRIAGYLANDGELSPVPLLAHASSLGKTVLLPVLHPLMNGKLWFAGYRPGEELAVNRFGIPEPFPAARRRLPAWSLDVVLAPMVCFDDQGNRLGMGGGFYDRTFSYLNRRQRWRKPLLIGVAYEFQRVDRLQREPWDVPLDGVLTEKQLYWIEETAD